MQTELFQARKPERGVVGWALLLWLLGVPLTIVIIIILLVKILD